MLQVFCGMLARIEQFADVMHDSKVQLRKVLAKLYTHDKVHWSYAFWDGVVQCTTLCVWNTLILYHEAFGSFDFCYDIIW